MAFSFFALPPQQHFPMIRSAFGLEVFYHVSLTEITPFVQVLIFYFYILFFDRLVGVSTKLGT